MNESLNDARARWGDHVAAVHELQGSGQPAPVAFGDLLQLDSDTRVVVHLPDNATDAFFWIEVDEQNHLLRKDGWLAQGLSPWSDMGQVLAPLEQLPEATQSELEPFRRGIVIGESHWDTGITFLDSDEYASFLAGDLGELADETANLVRKLWLTSTDEAWRVLWHTGEDWDGWQGEGPLEAAQAEALAEELPTRFALPVTVRPGVYRSEPAALNKIELWHGRELARAVHLCRGQGE